MGTNNSVNKELVRIYIVYNISTVRLSDVAEFLGYTENYTSRWIQKNFGMSFSDFVQNERCKMAAELLHNTRIPVGEIIQKVGYQNTSFFKSLFLKRYGMTPGEYRRKTVKKC